MPVLLTFQLQRLKTCNRQVSCLIITCSFVVSMSLIQWLLWAQPIIFALHLFRLFYVTKTQKWKKKYILHRFLTNYLIIILEIITLKFLCDIYYNYASTLLGTPLHTCNYLLIHVVSQSCGSSAMHIILRIQVKSFS